MKIPNIFYYYWTGINHFYFPYILSIKSVLKIEKPDKVIVYYNDPVPSTGDGSARCHWNYLATLPIEFRKFDINDFKFEFLSDEFYSVFSEKIDCFTLCEGTRPNSYRHFNISDLARYMVLYKHGGVYYDFDTLTIKSIKHLMTEHDAFISSCASKICDVDDERSFLTNGNLGSVPNHEFIKQVLLECQHIISHDYSTMEGSALKTMFGPPVIYKAYKKKSIEIMDYKIFNAIGNKGSSQQKIGNYYQDIYKRIIELPPEAHVLHMYTGKEGSSNRMRKYKIPQDILRKREENTFAKYYSEFIDQDMLEYNWTW